MRLLFAFLVPVAALAGPAQSAWAQGLGIHLGGININLGGSSGGSGGGLGVSVGGTSVSVGNGGISIGTGDAAPQTGGVPVGDGSTGGGGSNPDKAVELDQQASIDAVHAQRALPLDVILAKARSVTSGQVIDAKLIGYRNFLLYDLKVLAATGDVSELYFYARSGVQVQTR